MGKYIQYFKQLAKFNQRRNGYYKEPWVSYTEGKGSDYNISETEKKQTPFTIYALESGNITWALGSGVSVQYSKNGGSWTTMTSSTTISVVAGDSVAFKGTNSSYSGKRISATGNFSVKGNAMSLTSGDNFSTATTVGNSVFQAMFQDCTKLISASGLVLPATTLGDACYLGMFGGCSNLIDGPKILPALTLTDSCYSNMFQHCSSLKTAPRLPATTLNLACYKYMFSDCTSLTTAPELPAETVAYNCYQYMFQNCTSLITPPSVLPATTLSYGMCYAQMFMGCTSLEKTPDIMATTISVNNACWDMFRDCSNLNYVKAMFTTTPTSGGPTDCWLEGVSATGTFVKNSAASWNARGTYAVPSGWTIQTTSV